MNWDKNFLLVWALASLSAITVIVISMVANSYFWPADITTMTEDEINETKKKIIFYFPIGFIVLSILTNLIAMTIVERQGWITRA